MWVRLWEQTAWERQIAWKHFYLGKHPSFHLNELYIFFHSSQYFTFPRLLFYQLFQVCLKLYTFTEMSIHAYGEELTSSVDAVYWSSTTLKRLTLRNIQWHIMTHAYTYVLTSGCLSVFLIIYINIYKSDLKPYWISKDFPRTTKRTSSRLIQAI